MKRFITPTLQISIGLLSLTISLIFIAYSFGLLPNEEKVALEARAKISETLAVQLANLAGHNDADAIKDTIESVVSRGGDVLSIAVRGADGKLIVGSLGHDTRWVEPADGKSTATHVQVRLLNGDVPAGKIEIAFQPIAVNKYFLGLSQSMISFIGFIGLLGFVGYYLILKRALWELDPGRAIPERVKAAFDTLAEGVLIMDEKECVLLANDAFVKKIFNGSKPLLGSSASDLPWVQSDNAPVAPGLPWWRAMHTEESVLGVSMGIRNRPGQLQRLTVNATRIVDGRGIARGVIATFDDVTVLHQINDQLTLSNDQLRLSQEKISEQNQKLWLLASTDPLTGCLNRRTFFEKAEQALGDARTQRQPMSFLMLDADHFKSINDRFGHVVGDKVLAGLAGLLRSTCSDRDIVGRYGGEEFCIAITGRIEMDVERLADRIRQTVAGIRTWLPTGETVTVSIGIASLKSASCEIVDLVKRADEALYAAKAGGRNRFVNWDKMLRTSAAHEPDRMLSQR